MRAFVDTNLLIRHFTGDPPAQAERATAFLGADHDLILPDMILAEMVYVLESYYEHPRSHVAEAARSLLALPSVSAADPELLLRTIELHEAERLDFADAYLCASAELSGVRAVASFDRQIDRVATVRRVEPRGRPWRGSQSSRYSAVSSGGEGNTVRTRTPQVSPSGSTLEVGVQSSRRLLAAHSPLDGRIRPWRCQTFRARWPLRSRLL